MSMFVAACASEEPKEGAGSVVPERAGRDGGSPAVVAWPEDPPKGYRWVGDSGVVVAVPGWWTTGDTQCLLPVEDTVYVETGAITDCALPVPPGTHREVSSLAVISTRLAHGERIVKALSPDGKVGGEPVLTGQDCHWFGKSACRAVMAVPSRGVAFALHVAESDDVDEPLVRDSLRLLPNGWTTVPMSLRGAGYTRSGGAPPSVTRDYLRLLERGELVAEVERAEPPGAEVGGDLTSLPAGALLDVRPTPGSPIEEGGRVTLTVTPHTVE